MVEPISWGFAARAAWFAYQASISAIHNYSVIARAEVTERWLSALQSAETSTTGWKVAADKFRTADGPALMHAYYRGLPHMLIGALSASGAIEKGGTEWVLSMVNEATVESDQLAALIKDDPDVHKRHRLQVFPVLPALQCLSLADASTHQELCSRVARMLRETQAYAAGYTESACDQINQIIPQMLTDQLLAGPYAWRNFYVRDDVLDALMRQARSRDATLQFETGLGLSIQFLVYYKQSLVAREVPQWAVGQSNRIDDYFNFLGASVDPALQNLSVWGTQLQSHAREVLNQPEPHKFLVRQSSAAVIAAAYKTQDIPNAILQLCVLNNLRAASRSYGLSDETDRLDRIRTFLADHSITKKIARRSIDVWMSSNSPSRPKAREFADSLPDAASSPLESPSTVSTARGMTLDDLISELSTLRKAQSLPDNPQTWAALPKTDSAAYVIGKHIARSVDSLRYCTHRAKLKRKARDTEIKELVHRALEQAE